MNSHKCSRCEKEFGSYQALNAHKGQIHDTHAEIECAVCGNSFEVIESQKDLRKTCSKFCMGKDQSERFAGSGNGNFNEEVETDELVEMYESGLSSLQIKTSVEMSAQQILERLKKAGVDIRDDTFGTSQKTSFGLEVRSGFENITAEWLDRFGPEKWEYEPTDFPEPFLPDFVLEDDTVIEVWGMDSDSYNQQRERKESWYSENGYHLISVDDEDVQQMKMMMETARR